MDNLYNSDILPSQQALESVAALGNEFCNHQFETKVLLAHLKERVIETHFMDEQDHARWMLVRGADFIANPKLFAVAPLTYTCVFIGELFNKLDIEEIEQHVPINTIEQALLRLQTFTLH